MPRNRAWVRRPWTGSLITRTDPDEACGYGKQSEKADVVRVDWFVDVAVHTVAAEKVLLIVSAHVPSVTLTAPRNALPSPLPDPSHTAFVKTSMRCEPPATVPETIVFDPCFVTAV